MWIGSVPVRLAHAQWAATRIVPEQAITTRTRHCEDIEAVFEGLDEDFQLSIAVEIGHHGGGKPSGLPWNVPDELGTLHRPRTGPGHTDWIRGAACAAASSISGTGSTACANPAPATGEGQPNYKHAKNRSTDSTHETPFGI